jgi:hypothetical protein
MRESARKECYDCVPDLKEVLPEELHMIHWSFRPLRLMLESDGVLAHLQGQHGGGK